MSSTRNLVDMSLDDIIKIKRQPNPGRIQMRNAAASKQRNFNSNNQQQFNYNGKVKKFNNRNFNQNRFKVQVQPIKQFGGVLKRQQQQNQSRQQLTKWHQPNNNHQQQQSTNQKQQMMAPRRLKQAKWINPNQRQNRQGPFKHRSNMVVANRKNNLLVNVPIKRQTSAGNFQSTENSGDLLTVHINNSRPLINQMQQRSQFLNLTPAMGSQLGDEDFTSQEVVLKMQQTRPRGVKGLKAPVNHTIKTLNERFTQNFNDRVIINGDVPVAMDTADDTYERIVVI